MRPRRSRRSDDAADLMAALEASLDGGKAAADGPPALDRLAQLRPRQRPGRAVQRGPRPRRPLPPAPREGRRADRARAASAPRRTRRSRSRRSAHGYDLEDGKKLVILTDEDLAAAAPRKTRTIDIEAFVELDDVDPIFFDHPYFLAPAGEAEGTLRAYRLLVEVMASTDRAALGRFVLRTKEYLVSMRVRDDRLALTTMRFHDEVRPTKGIDSGGTQAGEAAARPGGGADRGARRRLGPASATRTATASGCSSVIERKRKGRTIEAPEARRRAGARAGPHGGAEGVARAGAVGRGLRRLGRRRRRLRRGRARGPQPRRALRARAAGEAAGPLVDEPQGAASTRCRTDT